MTSEYQHLLPRVDLAFLASLPLFAHVPSDLLASIFDEDAVHSYQDGDIIIHQGDCADGLFMLLHGQARVLTDGIFLVARRPYDILGELAFINQTVRNATVIAQGTVQALVLRAPLGSAPDDQCRLSAERAAPGSRKAPRGDERACLSFSE